MDIIIRFSRLLMLILFLMAVLMRFCREKTGETRVFLLPMSHLDTDHRARPHTVQHSWWFVVSDAHSLSSSQQL